MNIHEYSKEIKTLREAAFSINDIAVKIQDSQSGMDNHGDLIASEADVQSLFLACRLVLETLPTNPALLAAPKLLDERNQLRNALQDLLEVTTSGLDYNNRAFEQAKLALDKIKP